MNEIGHFLVDEGTKVARATAYFTVCFGGISHLRMLWLAEYDIDGWATARFVVRL